MGQNNPKVKSKKGRPPVTVADITDKFIRSIECLSTSLPIVMSTMVAECKKHAKLLNEFYEKYAEKTDESSEPKYILKLNASNYQRFKKLNREHEKLYLSMNIIPNNYIISLISVYDAFIGDFSS